MKKLDSTYEVQVFIGCLYHYYWRDYRNMAKKKAKNLRKEIAKKLDQEVGTRLENIRKGKLHMTQEQLGEIIDRSVPTVRRYENGLSRVPDEIKVVLNNKLGIRPEDLLLGESEIILTIQEEVSKYSDSRLLAYLQAISDEIAKRNKK